MTEVRDPELRDIHRRIDSLKEETERQYLTLREDAVRQHSALTEKLHNLEVALARGGRFPAAAWVSAAGLALSVIGVGAVLYSELQSAKYEAGMSRALMEEHVKGLGGRQAQWSVLDERVKQCESKLRDLEGHK